MQKYNDEGIPVSAGWPQINRKSWHKLVSAMLAAMLLVQTISPMSLFANPINPFVWAIEFTAGGTHYSLAHGLDVDATHLYNVGTYNRTVGFNGPVSTAVKDDDVYVVKIDPATQTPVWLQTAGGNSLDQGYDIAVDSGSGDVYAVGRFRNRMELINSNPTVAITATGTICCQNGDLYQGFNDAFVYKLDSNGDAQWAVGFGGTTAADIALATAFGNGAIHTTGQFQGTADFDPGAGTANLTSSQSGTRGDMFVYKLDANGNYAWADNLTAASGTGGQGISVDNAGNVYTAGYFRGAPGNFITSYQGGIFGGRDALVVKHDVNGTLLWARGFGGSEQATGTQDVAYDIIVDDATGDLYVTGTFSGTVDFDPSNGFVSKTSQGDQDIFVMSMDSNGAFKWVQSMGGPGNDQGRKIAIDSTNGVYVSGFFEGTANFDIGGINETLTATPNEEMFVVALNKSDGGYVSLNQLGGTDNDTVDAIEGIGLAVDDAATPSIYASGSFFGPADFDPDPTATFTLNGSSFIDGFIARLSSNQTPFAGNDIVTVDEDNATTSIDTLANDFDPDGAPVTMVEVGTPDMGGTAVLSGTNGVDYTPAADFFGTEIITYTITDGAPFGFSTAVISVTVTPINDAPLAVDDIETTVEDTPITINVTTNDSDHANPLASDGGQILQIASLGGTSNGGSLGLTGSPPTQVVYTPALDFVGTDVFTYTLSDSNGGFDTGTVTVTMTAVNDTPIALDDTYTLTHPIFQAPITPLDNDSDVEGDTLAIISIGTTDNGGVIVQDNTNPSTQINYTPNPTFVGTETFTYTVSDGNTTATATVFLNINVINLAPVAGDDTETVAEDSTANAIAVTNNDTDPEMDALAISSVGVPDMGGTAVVNGATIEYTPLADFVGTETYTYTVNDGNGNSDSAKVTMIVTNVNDDPTAVDDADTVAQDSSANVIAVTSNDTDPENDSLTVSSVGALDNGGTAVAATGNIEYTPATGFSGIETFTYIVEDGNGGSATATVIITVTATPNTAPVAVDDTATLVQDTTVSGDVLANDTDADTGNTLTVNTTPVVDVANGMLVLDASGMYTYTPTAGYVGPDSFEYEVSDGNGGVDTATVNLTVTAAVPTNNVPEATDDTAALVQDTTFSGDVLANDTDADAGDTLTVNTTPVTGVANGVLVLNADGTYNYTPAAGYVGTDSFEYEVSDGNGGTDTATVTITVNPVGTPVNNTPVAIDDSASVVQDTVLSGVSVLANDSDLDVDDVVTINTTPVTDVTNGTLVVNADGTYEYIPDAGFVGDDSFVYEVTDGNGGTDTATVTITVTAVVLTNIAPSAADDADSIIAGATLNGTTVLANDTDSNPDDMLTVNTAPVTDVENGLLALNADGTYSYTPNAGFTGTDVFVYQLLDGNGGTDTATVTITVVPASAGNSSPVSSTNGVVNATTVEGGALSGSLLDGVSDPNNDSLTVDTTPVTNASNGQLVINIDGTYSYMPNPNYVGPDSFTYRVEDGQGGSLVVTVQINVTAAASTGSAIFLPFVSK